MQTEAEAVANATANGKDCSKCGLNVVCISYRTVARMNKEQFTEQSLPFKAEDLAKICRWNASTAMLEMARLTPTGPAPTPDMEVT